MTLTRDISERLKARNVTPEAFQAVNRVLLVNGFLSRSDPATLRHYDTAHRTQELVREWLDTMLGVDLLHDERTQHFRVVPPRTRDEALLGPMEDMELRKELKSSLGVLLSACLLALRICHDDGVMQGARLDETGRITLSMQDFGDLVADRFDQKLPPATYERKALFAKLKKVGAVDVRLDDVMSPDAVLLVRPEVTTLVSEKAAREAIATLEARGRAKGSIPQNDNSTDSDTLADPQDEWDAVEPQTED